MSRTPKSISVTETYDVTAKSLKKGDSLWIGKRTYRVAANKKHDKDRRDLRLIWGSHQLKDEVWLVVPSTLEFNVRITKHTRIS